MSSTDATATATRVLASHLRGGPRAAAIAELRELASSPLEAPAAAWYYVKLAELLETSGKLEALEPLPPGVLDQLPPGETDWAVLRPILVRELGEENVPA